MEKSYNRELYLEAFRHEWKLRCDANPSAKPAWGFGKRAKLPRTAFSDDPKAGEIRIFADWKRPILGLLLEQSPSGSWTIVPISEFTVPATDHEILIGKRVYQLWNTVEKGAAFVARSWQVETVSAADLKDVSEAVGVVTRGGSLRADLVDCLGLPTREADDIRRQYMLAYNLRQQVRSRGLWMEYWIAGAACLAAMICGVWYFGREIQGQLASCSVASCAAVGDTSRQERMDTGAALKMSAHASAMKSARSSAIMSSSDISDIDTSDEVQVECVPPFEAPESDSYARERFAEFHENEFVETLREPLSTFGLDVDTASYATMRRYMTELRRLPPKDSVRLEEYVNYFDYGYDGPTGDVPVAVNCELAACPWNRAHRLLRVGLQARRIEKGLLPPANLVFLIDVSGSMDWHNGLDMAKSGLKMLVDSLREEDYVSIVTYANGTQVRLESTSGRNKNRICDAIDGLSAGGGTAGGAGLELAYQQAQRHFRRKGNNRVILVTDGDFNIGLKSGRELERFIAEKRDTGVFLTVLGVGHGNYQDGMMKKLANAGNGNYAFLDGMLEAKKVMMTEFGGTLCTVAKDVKLQLEFNPASVGAYRLLGYESRKLAAKDFNDDKKDAGEMGAGHTMTALYELVASGESSEVAQTDPLKYQKTTSVASGELLTVKLRYKEPDGEKSRLVETPIVAEEITRKNEASVDFRFAAAVAEAALALEDSKFKGDSTLKTAMERARRAKGDDYNGYRAEFVRLLEMAELHQRENRRGENSHGQRATDVE